MNNIEPLTPEGWFEEGHGIKRGEKNDYGIWMPYHSKGNVLWAPTNSVEDLVLRQLGEDVYKLTTSLHVLFFLS